MRMSRTVKIGEPLGGYFTYFCVYMKHHICAERQKPEVSHSRSLQKKYEFPEKDKKF